jgi:HlyD family secretion protein
MRVRVAAISAIVLTVALLTLGVFAEAGETNRYVEASGALEDKVFVVSVPPELALLTAEAGARGASSPTPARANKPIGRVDAVKVELGAAVKRGQVLVSVAGELAAANLERAQAQFEQIVATIESLEGTRGDLAQSRADLSETEAELKAKRTEAEQAFSGKYAEGLSKVQELEAKLALVVTGLSQAQAGLLAAEEAENDAQKLLDAAERLPDSDPTKANRIEQASAMLQGALKQQAVFRPTVTQLSEAKAQLEKGISGAEQGLAAGKQQYTQGVSKLDSALTKIVEGRDKINEGSSTVIRKVRILKKRRDQAEVGLSLARKLVEASGIKAGAAGRIRELKASEGMVAYPGQRLMLIADEKKLCLEVYPPVEEAVLVGVADEVEVSVDARPGRVFKGKVVGVGGKAIFAPSNSASGELELIRVMRVSIEVVNEDGILKSGMPADARIAITK